MAQVIKSVIVNWDWDGDTDAIRGFNVALTPQGGDPRDRTIAYALTGTANYSHRFDNVPLDNQVNYTGWVQALYEGDDSDWVNTNGVVYPDDGDNTIQRSIDIDERGLDESGNFTGSISGLAAEIARKYAEKGWETSGITGININDWSQRLDLSSLPSGITRSFEVSIERHNNRVYVRNKGSAENPGGSAVTFELEVNGAVCLGYDGSVGGTGLSETEIPADKGSNIDFENDPYGLYGPNGAIIRVNATGAGTDQGFLLFDNITESTVFRLRIVSVSDEDNFALGLGGRFVAFNTRMPFEAHFSPVDSQDLDALLLANGPAEAGATTNRVFRSNGAPTEPDGGFKDGDLWFDINDKILYEWNAATLEWDNIGNDFRDTSELTDGAALGNTALWDLITGAGKPESYADVTGTSDAHTQLVAQVDAVEQSSGENQTAIAGLSDRADTLESDAQALADRATAVEGRADNLETEAQALSGRADSLESESAAQAQEISDQAADLQQKAQDILANADNIAAIDVRVSDAESGVDANASAVNGLDVRVGQTESGVSANSSEISALESRVTDTESGGSANASAIQAIDTRVTTAEGEITSQSSDITSLENRVDDTETGVSGNSSAISGLDSRVTSAEGTITSQSSEITSLQAGQSVIRNADSLTGNAYFDEGFNGNQPTGWAAWAGGGQGPSFDALTGEKSVAFSRTPDQQAGINQEIHDVAEGLSGIEVEVVMKVVSGDANASGLIIDWHLVGGGASRTSTRFGDYADTLKTGVWQTMRIAIERPSQAEEYSHMNFFLMGQYGPLGTRYDVDVIFDRCVVRPLGADHAQVTGNSSAISGLDSRVTSAEGTITSHSSEITSLETRVGDNETGVSGNSSAISGLDSRVTDTEGQISSVASDVTALETRVSDNETGNSANSDAISALDSRVTTNEGDITSQASQITALGSEIDDAQAGVSGNATAISGLDTRVTSAEGEISSSASDISALGARVDDTESGVSGNSSAISGLDSRVTSAEGTITSHSSDITSLQNEVDDAQTGISGNSSAISGLDSRVTSAEGTITSQSSEITSLQASQQTMRQADSLLFNSYFDEGWGTGSPSGWTKYQKGASEDTGDWLTGGAAARCTLTASEEGGIRYSSDNDYVDGLKGVDVELAFKLLSGDAGAAGMLVGWKVAGGNYENRQYRIEDYADPALVGVWQTIKFAAPRPSESTSYEGFQFYALGSWNGFGVGRDVDILFDRCVVRPAGASLAAQGNASAISALDSRVTTAEGGITSNSSSITSLENRVDDTESGVSGNSSAISGLDSRVVATENSVASNASDITALDARVVDTETGLANNAGAINLLDTRVTDTEGEVSAQATALTELSTSVDGNTATISENATSIDGLELQYTVKLDNNGAISGFGLASEPSDGSGGSTSTFTITADKFEIADPSDTTEQSAPFQWTAGELKLKGDVYVDGAITAEKIAVGGIPDQLVVNGGAENGTTEGWYLTQGSDVGITVVPAVAGANGDSSFFINGKDTAYGCKAFPVVPGEKYYFRAGVVSASGTSFPNGQYLRIQYTGAKPTGQTIGAHAGQTPRDGYKDIRSNAEVPAVYTTYDYVWTVPAGVNWANLAIFNWSSGDPDGVYFDDVMVQRQLTGELIVNGTLTADHIQANSITLAEVASDIEGLGDTASWGQVTGAGRPADNADVTGNNTANDTSNVAGTSAATVRDRAEDPISRANAKSTRLAPGLVQISGSTNLDDWSHPSDTTTINGGQIFTESVTAEKIAADTFKTTNYAENGSGEPTAGAKLDHQGTALKVAADNLQVGPYVFTDAMVRVLQALDGDSTTNLYFYRGNNDVTERGGAPNIYALDIRSIREDTSDKDYEIELEILPINDDDNLDAMRYAELEFYVGTSSGASYAFTEYVQVPDRKYEHSTHSNAANAVRVSHWFESIYSSTGLRSTNTQYFFIKAKLHNAHGASQDLWFAPTNSLGTDWTKSTSAPYSGGSGAGNPPSGGGGSGYCPAPWVQIKLADGTSIAAEDLYDGAKIMGFDEFNEGKAFVNTVRMPMRRWEQRYRIELENALTTEYSCKHRLLVKGAHEGQRHWRAIESISAGDVVITDQGEARVSRVVRASKGPVISFMAEGNGTYIGDGFVSHNIKSATP